MSKIQEKLLLLQIQHQRDAASFTKLYELLAEPIYRFIFFKVSDEEIAKDITSEVFVRTWRELSNQQAGEVKHLKAYVYRIARNLVVDHYRKKETLTLTVSLEEAEQVPAPGANLQETIEVKLDSERMLALMANLKTSYQEVLLLRYTEDLSITEIAHIIQKSPVSTRVLLHRANQALKREYENLA